MNQSLKGALLSGLLFPGIGQITQKNYLKGFLIIVTTLASISFIVIKTVQHALTILEMIEAKGGVITMEIITKLANQTSVTSESLTYNFSIFVLILCWIVGVVDAYICGKSVDGEDNSKLKI